MLEKMKKRKWLIGLTVSAFLLGAVIWYQQSKVLVTEVLVGVGNGAKNGQTAVFDYRGFLYDSHAPKGLGREFDSTYKRHSTMRAVLGAKQVIPGLEKALLGMKAGGQRHVVIAPSMAYGDVGAGDGLVPPRASVVYQIELRSLE